MCQRFSELQHNVYNDMQPGRWYSGYSLYDRLLRVHDTHLDLGGLDILVSRGYLERRTDKATARNRWSSPYGYVEYRRSGQTELPAY